MSYKVCYVCFTAYTEDHECEVSKKLVAKPVDLKVPFVHGDAMPSRDLRNSK